MAAQPTPLVSLIRVLNQIAAELHLQQIPEISVVAEARQLRQRLNLATHPDRHPEHEALFRRTQQAYEIFQAHHHAVPPGPDLPEENVHAEEPNEVPHRAVFLGGCLCLKLSMRKDAFCMRRHKTRGSQSRKVIDFRLKITVGGVDPQC